VSAGTVSAGVLVGVVWGRRMPCGSSPVGTLPEESVELPTTGPTGAASMVWQLPGLRTGRSSTTPDTSTASSACCWSRTPGRSTTIVSPWTRTSGSAIPCRSSSERIWSRITVSSSADAGSVGDRITDTPPCRSRPRIGVLSVAMLNPTVITTISTTPISEVQRRRVMRPAQSSSSALAEIVSSTSASASSSSDALPEMAARAMRIWTSSSISSQNRLSPSSPVMMP
jgi:hypothetical protein